MFSFNTVAARVGIQFFIILLAIVSLAWVDHHFAQRAIRQQDLSFYARRQSVLAEGLAKKVVLRNSFSEV